ncbi:DUF4113 domain-containing protein [Pontibacter saemangeumensis]
MGKNRFGRGKVRVAAQGVDKAWQLRSDMLTCYTTRFSECHSAYVR